MGDRVAWNVGAIAHGIPERWHRHGAPVRLYVGSVVGDAGEREIQTQSTGRFAKRTGTYSAASQEIALEFVPIPNFRVELAPVFAFHNIGGVTGFEDRHQTGIQGVSVDLRYRFLDKDAAPFGFTVAAETHANRLDEGTGERVRQYGTDLTFAFDKDLIPNFLVAAVNLLYQLLSCGIASGSRSK